MLLLFTIFFIVATLYIVEVRLGSAISVYNCELGQASVLRAATRLSQRELFSKMLPLLFLALGFLLPGLQPALA